MRSELNTGNKGCVGKINGISVGCNAVTVEISDMKLTITVLGRFSVNVLTCQIDSSSCISTDGQSASSSRCRAPFAADDQILNLFK
jgi:hypothetical protein